MVILQCLVFDWILVNVFKVDVEHYWPLNADVTVYGSFTVTSDGRVGVNKGGGGTRTSLRSISTGHRLIIRARQSKGIYDNRTDARVRGYGR